MNRDLTAAISVAASLGLGCLAALAGGTEPPAEKTEQPSKTLASTVKASLVLERETIMPGETIDLAVALEIAAGWHTYWNGDNDSGFPTDVKLTLPAGLTAGPIKWPVPVRHVSDGDILDYVYFDRCTLLVPITASATFAGASKGEIVADVSWLVCREGCVPGSATLKTAAPFVAPIAPSDKPKPGKVAPEVKAARELLPAASGEKDPRLSVKWEKDALVIGFEGSESLTFMPSADGASVQDPIKTASTKKAREPLTLHFKPDSESKPGTPAKPVLGIVQAKVPGASKPVNLDVRIDRPK